VIKAWAKNQQKQRDFLAIDPLVAVISRDLVFDWASAVPRLAIDSLF
jgi:hypothetical protein